MPQPCPGRVPSPVNMGFVRRQAGMDPAEGWKEPGHSMGGPNSTFPLALQLLVVLYERSHRAVRVPRKTLGIRFPVAKWEGGSNFSPLLSLNKYVFA